VQKSTNKTVLITEDGVKATGESKKRIQDTATHFETILKVSEENMVTAKQVDMTVTQQTNSIDQAAEAIKNVQLTADDVKNSTKQTLNTAQMLLKMADGLAQI
jgi:methyl-accepting chemotaxis protein